MKVAGVGAVVFGDGTILLSNSSDSVVSSVTRTGMHTARRKMYLPLKKAVCLRGRQ